MYCLCAVNGESNRGTPFQQELLDFFIFGNQRAVGREAHSQRASAITRLVDGYNVFADFIQHFRVQQGFTADEVNDYFTVGIFHLRFIVSSFDELFYQFYVVLSSSLALVTIGTSEITVEVGKNL